MKLTKAGTKLHDQAQVLIDSDHALSRDERAFCFENYRPGANHNIGKGGIFFTPPDMACTLANMHSGGGRILDACAGIGVLARAMLDQDWGKTITEIVCLETNPEFVRVGQRLVPEARWIRGDIFNAKTVLELGVFDSAVSNPPFGNVPRETDYCRHNAPAHLMVAEVLIRRCEQGAVMIIPSMDHSREDSDNRPSSAYLRFVERFPDAMLVPLSVDCSCFDFHGAKPNCAMVNLETPNVSRNPYWGEETGETFAARNWSNDEEGSMMRSTVHFTSNLRTFEICQCGLPHVLRQPQPPPPPLRILPDPPSGASPRFDYKRQAWIVDGKYIRCAHPESMNCTCYGKLHEGEQASHEAEPILNNLPVPVLAASPIISESTLESQDSSVSSVGDDMRGNTEARPIRRDSRGGQSPVSET